MQTRERTFTTLVSAVVLFLGLAQVFAADSQATLKQYAADLQRNPSDYELREKIIKLAREMNPPPAVPEEARRHAVMADTLVKEAKKPEEFRDGAGEFKHALLIAPWCIDLYPPYAVALKSAGEYDEAIRVLRFYIAVNPGGSKARDAQDEIYILEAKQKKARKEKEEKSPAAKPTDARPQSVASTFKTTAKKMTDLLGGKSGTTPKAIMPEQLVGRWSQPGNNMTRWEIEHRNGLVLLYMVSTVNRSDLDIRLGEKTLRFNLKLDENRQLTGPPPPGPFGRVSGTVSKDGQQIQLFYPSYDSRMSDADIKLIRE
ncbi:MAG: hypothetical protein A2283_00050 [Lentisphaerae bacterium RIFOXYA12_FULL_48_11]|nr:MAG: hypothetical protein A2283_00050 [Lentisphaerae bacterium RIFOXYA12_FULL_48_11]